MKEKNKASIKELVDWLNTDENSPLSEPKIPIVAFQFVSLDKPVNGKMIWWEYIHQAAHVFNDAVKELITDKSTGNTVITKTLINWEYKKNIFWYEKLGNGKIIEKITDNFLNNFEEVNAREDKTCVEREPSDDKEKCALLLEWEDILRKKFECKGSTMWISIPHFAENDNNDQIFSSIFCVFNGALEYDARIKVYRIFRNFITNYLIKLYRESEQAITASQRLIDNSNINDYIPKFNRGILKDWYSKTYLSDFDKVIDRAMNSIIYYNRNNGEEFDKIVFSEVKNIKKKEHFIHHFMGRYLLLGFCLIYKMTIREAFELISLNEVRILECKDINVYFKIQGLRDKKGKGKGNGLCNENILPHLSKKEINFLYDCAYQLNKQDLVCELSSYKNK